MNPLHELIRRLPPGVEFLVVVMWAFGLPIFSSILSIGPGDGDGAPRITNIALISVLVMELVQSLFLIWFLRIRGWTLEKVGLSVTWRGTVLGVMLFAVTWAVVRGVLFISDLVLPDDMKMAMHYTLPASKDLSVNLLLVVSAVNGIFEEGFVAGYIITALSQARSPWTGINVSTGVRLLYSLYHGPIGVLTVVPIGLLFGYVYARTRMLWPLILAHIVYEMTGILLGNSP